MFGEPQSGMGMQLCSKIGLLSRSHLTMNHLCFAIVYQRTMQISLFCATTKAPRCHCVLLRHARAQREGATFCHALESCSVLTHISLHCTCQSLSVRHVILSLAPPPAQTRIDVVLTGFRREDCHFIDKWHVFLPSDVFLGTRVRQGVLWQKCRVC